MWIETSWLSCNPRTHTKTGLPLGLHFTNNYVPGGVLSTYDDKIRNKQNLSKITCGDSFLPTSHSHGDWVSGVRIALPRTGRVFAVGVTQIKHPWLPAQYLSIPSRLPVCFRQGAAQYWWQKPGEVCSAQNRTRPSPSSNQALYFH